MAVRTTVLQVQGILRYNWDGKTDLTPFIAGASMVVDQALPLAAKRKVVYTTEQQELIERYLAAHFYCKMDPLYMSKSTGGASGGFQRKMDEGFQLTEYGRAAVEMEVSGILNAIGKRQRASALHVSDTPDCPTTWNR